MDKRIKKIIYGFLKSGTTELPIIRVQIFDLSDDIGNLGHNIMDIMNNANLIEVLELDGYKPKIWIE